MLRFKARRRQSPALKPQGELTASERRVIRMLDAAMQAVARQAQSQLTRIADAVAHKPDAAVADLVTVDPWYEMQRELEAELLGELLDAGSRVQLPAIQKATLNFAFDRDRPESAAWARAESANLVREITDGQRQAIRDVIVFGQEQGLSPQDTARRIQQTVGLTSQQAGWVSNFHTRQVSAGIASGLSLEQAVSAANGATARYQQQIHRYRAMTIARTEIMRANSQGRQQAWGQGLQGGWISPTAQKEWIAEMDACEICAPVNGTRVGVNALFPIGEPPAHPNCRCDVLLIPDPVPTDLSGLSGAQLDSMIGDLLSGDLLPTVPTPGAQPALTQTVDDIAQFPGALRDFTYFSDDGYRRLGQIADEFAESSRERWVPDNPFSAYKNEDTMLKAILDDQGFSGKGTIVDDDTFDALRANDDFTYLGRGMSGESADEVAKYTDALIDGELYAGRGMFGNGTYMTDFEDTLKYFATKDVSGEDMPFGAIVDTLLKPNAKVIDFKDAYTAMQDDVRRMYGDIGVPARLGGQSSNTRTADVIDDVGAWAAAKGYDAVRIPDPYINHTQLKGVTYWNVLNRQALVFRRNTRGAG